MSAFDPVEIEIANHQFQAIAEEMGVTLMRAAFSPNIKERRDHSCAVFDSRGELIAQAAHIPVHLGSMELSVQAAIKSIRPEPGQTVAVNDPYHGGTHLPDLTLVTPVYAGTDSPLFFVANRAHHADVGGIVPGSLPLSRHIDDEGYRLEPTALTETVTDQFCAASRTPEERRGDLAAQLAANRVGQERVEAFIEKRGADEALRLAEALQIYADRLMRETLRSIPDGQYAAEDVMEDDGFEATLVPIRVAVSVTGDECVVDFSASADQVPGPINAVRAIATAATFYVFRTLASASMPTNSGCLRPIRIVTREGSIVDACYPSPVAVGNVETSQRIVDVLLRALHPALPDRVPAGSVGSMNNVCMGGDTPAPFVYYETIGGGSGAGRSFDGTSGVHCHMTNTLNTPAEALEHAYPLRLTAYSLRSNSSGRGHHNGGEGMVREYEFLQPTYITVIAERHSTQPYGLDGGKGGAPGRLTLLEADGRQSTLKAKHSGPVLPGQRLRVETAGGGGYGKAED